MRKLAIHSESGFAMLLALVVMLIISLLTVAVANVALSEYATAKTNEHAMQAFFVADGALDRALAVLGTDDDWSNASNSWQPLDDAFNGGLAVGRPFPPAAPIPGWTYSIYLRSILASPVPTGNCTGVGSSFNDPVNNVWVRSIGRVGRASRTVEFVAHRLSAGDMTTYSAQDVILNDPSATGAGNVEVHGSLYVRGDLGLKAVQTGIYNDRPLFSGETDPPGYCNQLWVKGTLDMTQGNATVGTPTQLMRGVHAAQILVKRNRNPADVIYTRSLDNDVPDIPYPDVQGFVNILESTQTYANALSGNDLVICHKDGATFNPTPITSSNLDLNTMSGVYYLPARAYWNSLNPQQCGADLDNPSLNAWVLKWDCADCAAASPYGRLFFNTALNDQPILVNGKVQIGMNVVVYGIGTIVVDYPDPTQWAMDSGSNDGSGKDPSGVSPYPGPCPSNLGCQVLTSRPASQGFYCPGYTSMPCQDLPVFVVNGNVRINGSGTTTANCNYNGYDVPCQENDVIVVAGDWDDPNDPADPAHLFISMKKVIVYGIVITNKLDTSQNPDFLQVPDVASYMPFPFAQLLGSSGGSVVYRVWREVF